MTVTLQAQITAEEKAIRLLIGERAALKSKLFRAQAKLKLDRTRLAASLGRQAGGKLTVASRFPDVSNFQPNINVPQIHKAASVRVGALLVTKISEGTGFIDRFGTLRFEEMAHAGFPHRGGYAFLHPSQSGTAQANLLLRQIGGKLTANDIVIADLEVSDGQGPGRVAACAREFAGEIRKHHKGRIWLYGGGPFLHENGVTLDGYDAHWLAAYVSNPAPFELFGQRTAAWQYTDGVHGPGPHACPGIGSCDLSIVLH